jgi:hypothetical protein
MKKPGLDFLQCLFTALCGLHLIAFLGEEPLERDNDPALVVDDQQSAFHWCVSTPSAAGAEPAAAEFRSVAARGRPSTLDLIESRPDITYQLLISAVETMAGVALSDYKPEEAEKLKTKQNVLEKARALGIDDEKAKALALEACQGMTWLKQKFKKFILNYVSSGEVSGEDPVFPWLFLRPAPENFERVLGQIYDARSGNLHRAYPFPPWVGLGTSSTVDPRNVPFTGLAPKDVPPVPWFERVVSIAARRFLMAKCSVDSQPFAA